MNDNMKNAVAVKTILVTENSENQRIDNFLSTRLKGVPKSRIYRALREGQCRVNKKRVPPSHKLKPGDIIRVPPIRVATQESTGFAPSSLKQQLEKSILYEDKNLLILNKPAGIASHGGSGIRFGVIETFRQLRPRLKFLELVHRLDRETTGCLMLAKKSSVLKELQKMLLERQIKKHYLALLAGQWKGEGRWIKAPLRKNTLRSGERMVCVDKTGKPAETWFEPLKQFKHAVLVLVKPLTGRTHQIRVHAALAGHPILGDHKYGDEAINKALNVKQLLLHAASLQLKLPGTNDELGLCACLPKKFLNITLQNTGF